MELPQTLPTQQACSLANNQQVLAATVLAALDLPVVKPTAEGCLACYHRPPMEKSGSFVPIAARASSSNSRSKVAHAAITTGIAIIIPVHS